MATALAPSARFEQARCDSCASDRQAEIYAFDYDGEKAAIVTCSDCGLSYSSPRPRPDHLGGFYGSGYYSFGPPSLPDLNQPPARKERWRRAILARHLGYPALPHSDTALPHFATRFLARFLVIPPYQEDGKLLDVGCGSGDRMAEFQAFGWNITGLEFSEDAASAGRSAGLDIRTGDLTSAPFAPESFSTICFYHSLEHVYSPTQTLKAALQLLKPGGTLLVAVPNFASSERRMVGRDWAWLQMPTHLYHFTPRTLRKCVADAGFADIDVRYSFHGWSVDPASFGRLGAIIAPLLKIYAVFAAALWRDGKAITLTAHRPIPA